MSIELDKGSLSISFGDKTIPLGEGVPFTEEIELSAAENPPHLYHFHQPSVNFEISGDDLSWTNNFWRMPSSGERFIIEAYRHIMIQARWHKKVRIRKKWLKRFGMKSDTVKMRANAIAGEYHTDNGNFEFETDAPEYLWRPDQLRRGLKIE